MHRLATFFDPGSADHFESDMGVAAQRTQLLHEMLESCDYIRGVGAPQISVLNHLRGCSKNLLPSVRFMVCLLQLAIGENTAQDNGSGFAAARRI